jgi:hypothetical protein
VIWKLLSFSFAMFALPIGTYFFTVKYVFNGKTSLYASITGHAS